jgi:cytochrome c oxidase assembly protein subunit 15
MIEPISSVWLRRYAKGVCAATFFLVFAGSMVTSTGSGLAVPDWPLSYGMLFPPMVGGVFYEHGHRLVAATVGLMTVILAGWLHFSEPRRWLRGLGYLALATVILQGVLGGITVLFFLPTPISVSHALLAQGFLVITVLIAYSLSRERAARERRDRPAAPAAQRWAWILAGAIYLQLLLGALMRHTGSGLAIHDFPRMAGYWAPPFDDAMLWAINDWRFFHNLPPVGMNQVILHFAHRVGAVVVAVVAIGLSVAALFRLPRSRPVIYAVLAVDGLLLVQIGLGALTVWSRRAPLIASLHVVTGAAILGLCVVALLRARPVPPVPNET